MSVLSRPTPGPVGAVVLHVVYPAATCPPGQTGHWEVAPSFAAFLAMLTDYDPDHVKAIKSGDAGVLRSWLVAGGDPSQVYRGMSLLAYGVCHAQPEAVLELLARGAPVQKHLLIEAEHVGCRQVIDLLRAHQGPARGAPRGAPRARRWRASPPRPAAGATALSTGPAPRLRSFHLSLRAIAPAGRYPPRQRPGWSDRQLKTVAGRGIMR
jgi:hypothetical protein